MLSNMHPFSSSPAAAEAAQVTHETPLEHADTDTEALITGGAADDAAQWRPCSSQPAAAQGAQVTHKPHSGHAKAYAAALPTCWPHCHHSHPYRQPRWLTGHRQLQDPQSHMAHELLATALLRTMCQSQLLPAHRILTASGEAHRQCLCCFVEIQHPIVCVLDELAELLGQQSQRAVIAAGMLT